MDLATIELFGQIADLKETDYKNTLAIAVLVELLVDKGLLSKNDFALKAHELDNRTLAEMALSKKQGHAAKEPGY